MSRVAQDMGSGHVIFVVKLLDVSTDAVLSPAGGVERRAKLLTLGLVPGP
jgi:hypothetical protein